MKRERNRLTSNIISLICVSVVIPVIFFAVTGYFKSKEPETFLPDLKAIKSEKPKTSPGTLVISNKWYQLNVDSLGKIIVMNVNNEPILSRLTYFADYKGHNEIVGLDDVKVSRVSDSVIVLFGKIDELAYLTLTFLVDANEPELHFTVTTRYIDSVIVLREALIADYDIPVTEVYLKNGQTESKPGHGEYWLGKQGVKLGSGRRSSLIFHPQKISSLQLDTKSSEVIINLDYSLDHPFMEIPFQKDAGARWADKSAAEHKPGDERTDQFSVVFGYLPMETPRLMLVPYGYLAGYVFTEHADGGNIRTQRAAYFGDENITDISMAIGGFAGHKIPVTKSIYFNNIDEALSDSVKSKDAAECDYLNFLDQLYKTGLYDLCLHTPEDTNSNRSYLEKAISVMKQRYDTKSWIDHGMFPGNNNRETLVADGLNPKSEYYAADLWERYGTKFFWSPAVEMIRFSRPGIMLKDDFFHLRFSELSGELWRRYNYRKYYLNENTLVSLLKLAGGHFSMYELNSLQPLEGNYFPTPLYWQNETLSRSIYSWTTEYVYHGIPNDSKGLLDIEKHQLDLLIKNWGVFFNHGYYVRNRADDNIISDTDGSLHINPRFDDVLEYMEEIRDNGDLYITTVKDLLNYWLLLENVKFECRPDGTIYVINNNCQQIRGISLAVRVDNRKITLDGYEPLSRIYNNNLIFWFDIPAHSRKALRFFDQR